MGQKEAGVGEDTAGEKQDPTKVILKGGLGELPRGLGTNLPGLTIPAGTGESPREQGGFRNPRGVPTPRDRDLGGAAQSEPPPQEWEGAPERS